MIALLSDCFPGAYEKDIRWKKINRLAPSVSVLCFVSLFVWLRRQSLTSNIIVHSWGAGGGVRESCYIVQLPKFITY